MEWQETLRMQLEATYRAASHLIDLAGDMPLDWKPARENNWMALGQLLKHVSNACGEPFQGFVTGDWGIPVEELTMETMLPPAEKMPAVGSADEARKLLESDKALAFKMIDRCAAENLFERPTSAPWDQRDLPLGFRFAEMIEHLSIHRAQLFYYLKLYGKAVNTMDMYGMK